MHRLTNDVEVTLHFYAPDLIGPPGHVVLDLSICLLLYPALIQTFGGFRKWGTSEKR